VPAGPAAGDSTSSSKNPGHAVNTSALYRLPWAQVFVRAVSTAAIGALQGALDSYLSIASKRVSTNTGKATRLDPAALNAAARTQSAVLEMKSVLRRNFDELLKQYEAGTLVHESPRR